MSGKDPNGNSGLDLLGNLDIALDGENEEPNMKLNSGRQEDDLAEMEKMLKSSGAFGGNTL